MQTFTVGEGDDLITYDVRGDLVLGGVPLFMFGSPMEASGFGDARRRTSPDRPVVTYDPRGDRPQPDGHRPSVTPRAARARTCTG